uniref:NADH dehydrogenase subunit 4L n=1 Tax=Proteromonas lacertae TaxID=42746 RepID=E2E9Y9_PROLC|nr:NADH dehydrogenase subunit 4L [Proteromonas lacertae]YP_003795238.1 NADH dehydrogenase subunit 4L [Proteromonas lacertae]ADD46344.1 NADH dehydrogenase subunit 4L [Proteromonas lacertae]ADD46376.1 NADH dehydrogenase subunit 4L [Proteromonas lacertae]
MASFYISVGIAIFSLGLFGIIINKKNILLIIISIELLLLGVTFSLVAYSVFLDDIVGQFFVLLILTVAAAESSIGLSILVVHYRIHKCILSERYNVMLG